MDKLVIVPVLSLMVWALYVVDTSQQIHSLDAMFISKKACDRNRDHMNSKVPELNRRYIDSGRDKVVGMGMEIDRFGCAKVQWRPYTPSYEKPEYSL